MKHTDGQTDRCQTVTIRLPIDAANLKNFKIQFTVTIPARGEAMGSGRGYQAKQGGGSTWHVTLIQQCNVLSK